HQPDRPEPDHHEIVARTHLRLLEAAQHARERLDERRVLVGDVRRNLVHVALYDALGNAYVLGVGAVIEKQVLAQVLESALAVETLEARGRVCGDHPLAGPETLYPLAYRYDIPGQFVSEQRWRHDHSCVVASPEDLHVRSASQSGTDPYQHVPLLDCRYGDRL